MQTENNSMHDDQLQARKECYSYQILFFMEVSSTALILLLTLVAPLRNWLSSTKSSKRLKVFNISSEYEMFFELMHPKIFKKISMYETKA